jgi:hypothetical protein
VQEAIKNHQILVGMDKEMVTYAKGRAPKKVRDKDDNGVEYEEWIYGDPPQEVDFVRFQGNLVSRLEIMTVDGEKIVRTEREVNLASQETQVAEKTDTNQQHKPANAPTLRRPGEAADDDGDNRGSQPGLYPPRVDPAPGSGPGQLPPHWAPTEAGGQY